MAHRISVMDMPSQLRSKHRNMVQRAYATPDGAYIVVLTSGTKIKYEKKDKKWINTTSVSSETDEAESTGSESSSSSESLED